MRKVNDGGGGGYGRVRFEKSRGVAWLAWSWLRAVRVDDNGHGVVSRLAETADGKQRY